MLVSTPMFWSVGTQFEQYKFYWIIKALQIEDGGQNDHQIARSSCNSFIIYLWVVTLVTSIYTHILRVKEPILSYKEING